MSADAVTRNFARRAMFDAYDILDTPPEENFDDLVELAREICETPTALVSLVDDDRQWFKARVGFSECETNLDSSVCQHGLDSDELLVITDLTADPRTAQNPLVAQEGGIRFYAGAPLRVESGDVLGMLCVIDTVPRPDGLTVLQHKSLLGLARQVVANLELRRQLRNRAAQLAARELAEADLAASEARWRGLFESMSEGFILGEVIRDDDGRIVDWRYVDVNEAWAELVGIPVETAVGRTIREVSDGIDDRSVAEYASVVETGGVATLVRQVRSVRRWYQERCFRIDRNTFAVIFREVTAEVLEARRNDALIRLADGMRECRSVAEMTRLATDIIGETLFVAQAGYGRVDAQAEFVNVNQQWSVPALASLVGQYRFAEFGRYSDALVRGEMVVIDDPRSDPRTSAMPEALLNIGIQALVNVPLRDRGSLVAILIVLDVRPRKWLAEELAFLGNVADRLESGIARVEAEEQQQVLHHELAHRMKNQLAVVQAVASQTLRQSTDLKSANTALGARLAALGRATDTLVTTNWNSAQLHDLVEGAFSPHAGMTERVRVTGPRISFNAQVALSLTLALHELVTNATKYGALSNDTGHVDLDWSIAEEAGDTATRFRMTWQEVGGPLISTPTRRGFGSLMIERSLRSYLRGEATISFDPNGLKFSIDAPFAGTQGAGSSSSVTNPV